MADYKISGQRAYHRHLGDSATGNTLGVEDSITGALLWDTGPGISQPVNTNVTNQD